MEQRGRHNIGQLVREQSTADDVALVGFGSHPGSVIAGEEWSAPMEVMSVPEAQHGSYEDVFHRAAGEYQLLVMDDLRAGSTLTEERGHRAIGVVYNSNHEAGNYLPTVLPKRYDAFIHLNETTALSS